MSVYRVWSLISSGVVIIRQFVYVDMKVKVLNGAPPAGVDQGSLTNHRRLFWFLKVASGQSDA